MVRELGPTSQLNGGSGTAMAPPPRAAGRWPLTRRGSSLFLLPAELRRAQPTPSRRSRAQSNPAELSRAQPNSSTLQPPPPERRRASELAAPAAEEAPPQGEEVPALRRPPAAEAGPVAPRRERPAEAARPRGRARGVDVAPARLPPSPPPRPQAFEPQSALSIPLPRTLPRARTGLNSGSGLHVGISTAQESLCVDRTASLEHRPYQSCASAWALPLRQLCKLRWPEGAACHGGSHLPGGPHRHRLQRPCRLLAATALGHSLLGLPLSFY